jgi:Uma2 family endonuclease
MAMANAVPHALPRFGWTVERLHAIDDERNRYEIIDGELFVTPSPIPAHQRVSRELFVLLHAYVRANRLGQTYYAPLDMHFSPITVVEPDLLVVKHDAVALPSGYYNLRDLHLVIEILSPGTSRRDRDRKRRLYQEAGIAEYWIVDHKQRQLEVWTPSAIAPVVKRVDLIWHPSGAGDALCINLPRLFADALDPTPLSDPPR